MPSHENEHENEHDPGRARRWRLDDLDIDLDRQQVRRGDTMLPVGGLSFRLLQHLLLTGPRIASYEELIASVWAPAVVNEETVTQRVKLLRQALGDDGRRARYIRSVRAVGYQLCSPPQPLASEQEEKQARTGVPIRTVVTVVAAAAMILAVAAVGLMRTDTDTVEPIGARPVVDVLQRAAHYAAIGQDANNERAIALLEPELERYPGRAEVLIPLSRAYSARVCLYNHDPHWAGRAQELAESALARTPDLAAAHSALGYAHDCSGRLALALASYEYALALDPDNDGVRASAAYLYERSGRLAEALAANLAVRDRNQARYLDIQIASNLERLGFVASAETLYADSFRLYPDSVFSNIAWPRFLFTQGRIGEAEQTLAEAMQRGTDHVDLHLLDGEIALLLGRDDHARRAFRRAADLRPHKSWAVSLLLLVDESDSSRDQARQRARTRRAQMVPGQIYPSDWLEVAVLDAGTGNREQALDALTRAIDAGYRDQGYLQRSPLLRPLAGEPGFVSAIDRIAAATRAERERVLQADWLPEPLRTALTASP